jgi:hypothetical protein
MVPHQQQSKHNTLPLHFKTENEEHYKCDEKNHHKKHEREISSKS